MPSDTTSGMRSNISRDAASGPENYTTGGEARDRPSGIVSGTTSDTASGTTNDAIGGVASDTTCCTESGTASDMLTGTASNTTGRVASDTARDTEHLVAQIMICDDSRRPAGVLHPLRDKNSWNDGPLRPRAAQIDHRGYQQNCIGIYIYLKTTTVRSTIILSY